MFISLSTQMLGTNLPAPHWKGFDSLDLLVSCSIWKARNRSVCDGVSCTLTTVASMVVVEAIVWVANGSSNLALLAGLL